MCCHLLQDLHNHAFIKRLSTEPTPDLPSLKFIAPHHHALALRWNAAAAAPQPALLRWGLIPHWAPSPDIARRTTHARSETLHLRPAYRHAARHHRAVIPVSAWAEHPKRSTDQVPLLITDPRADTLLLAALWERWCPPGTQPVDTFTLITTHPPAALRHINSHTPSVVHPNDLHTWLNPATPPLHIHGLASRSAPLRPHIAALPHPQHSLPFT